MLNLISSLDLWLSWKTLVSAVFVFLLGAARPKESQDFQAAAAAAAAASHPKSCELDHNDGGVEASHCEMCAWAETVDAVGHPQIPIE